MTRTSAGPARNTESAKPTSSHSTSTPSKNQAHTITEKKRTSSDHRVQTAASTQPTTRLDESLRFCSCCFCQCVVICNLFGDLQ